MTSTDFSPPPGHRSGYVAIVGQPNVGKSTLLNALLKYKVSIVSAKPQTTRNRILGIHTDAQSQIIFLDTPGIHQPDKELNQLLLEVARRALAEVDVVVYLVDSERKGISEDEALSLSLVKELKVPRILAPNKIDRIEKPRLLPLIERYMKEVAFDEVIPISAAEEDGLDRLLDAVRSRLPEGPRYYPDDQLSDATERDLVAELVREKVFIHCRQEIPYSTAVVVEAFEEKPERNLVHIHATIHVEKDSQKGILIGKKGAMLRQIGADARMEIERVLGVKVFLELFVRVEPNWTRDPKALRKLGLSEK